MKEAVKLAGLRGIIARRMAESAAVPSVTLSTRADVTDAIAFQRERVGEWRQHKLRPQYQDLVIAAVARALKETPAANTHLVGDELRVLDEVNVGVAMAVAEGLLVPVIKNADEKSLRSLNRRWTSCPVTFCNSNAAFRSSSNEIRALWSSSTDATCGASRIRRTQVSREISGASSSLSFRV